jgi:hypothetical protein
MGDLDKVSTHFPTNLSSDRIHMLVQLPISKRVVTCHVKYGLKTGRFCWVVYSETRTTLKVLKDKFRHTFSIPNKLKDEDINVNHETKSSLLTDGAVLREINLGGILQCRITFDNRDFPKILFFMALY